MSYDRDDKDKQKCLETLDVDFEAVQPASLLIGGSSENGDTDTCLVLSKQLMVGLEKGIQDDDTS